jgi:hypothetical protein
VVRMPTPHCCCLSAGAFRNAWITARPRSLAVLAAWCAPFAFVAGAAALWYVISRHFLGLTGSRRGAVVAEIGTKTGQRAFAHTCCFGDTGAKRIRETMILCARG